MKNLIFVYGVLLGLVAVQIPEAALAKTRLSIVEFDDKSSRGGGDSDGCYREWWYGDTRIGSAFKEILIEQLMKEGKYEVLEREHIQKVYDNEHTLVNSQNAMKPKKGNFKVAQYTLAGTVEEFQYCAGGGGAHFDIGSLVGVPELGVGMKSTSAHVKVHIRLIDVETGEILSTKNGVGDTSSHKVGIDLEVQPGAAFSVGGFKNSSLGEAVTKAITKAAGDLIKEIPET
jgi:curli biogenesis system outer membrane secretion channel CsgG